MFNKTQPAMDTINMMVNLAERARRDGILALESEISKLNDAFLCGGLKMAVDGVDPDTIEATMRLEIMAMQDRHKSGKKFFDLLKTYGPGLGLVATLMGQIGMFKNLGGDIATMGYMLAVAVVATMYGTRAGQLRRRADGRQARLPLGRRDPPARAGLQGILSIQAGENPRSTLDKMAAFVPAVTRTPSRPPDRRRPERMEAPWQRTNTPGTAARADADTGTRSTRSTTRTRTKSTSTKKAGSFRSRTTCC
jgi:chemotaxis protein MotA